MFGKNEQLKTIINPHNYLTVREIFETIQGEGPLTGRPATFVRLAGCNLKCHFCDTDFDINKARRYSIDDIVRKCIAFGHDLVVITGGEPLLQSLSALIKQLRAHEIQVQIETAGSIWPDDLTEPILSGDGNLPVCVVVSPKTPNIHPLARLFADAFKYPISANDGTTVQNGVPVCNTQVKGGIAKALFNDSNIPKRAIYVQPIEEYWPDGTRNAGATECNVQLAIKVCMMYGYTLSLQTHKILGLP